MNLVRQGFLDNAITEVLEEFALAQPEIRKWSASVQAHYDRAGAMLLKGTENSDNSYALQRAIIMLANETPLKIPEKQRKLPKILRGGVPELQARLYCAVETLGGPWNVTWGDKVWIEQSVLSPLQEEAAGNDKILQAVNWLRERAQSPKQKNVGSILKLFYFFSFTEEYKTSERMEMLRQHENEIESWVDIDRNETEWRKLVDQYPNLWGSVPHASFLACCFYRHFIHARARRAYTKEDGVIIPGLTSLPKVKEEIRMKAIGEWKTGDTNSTQPVEVSLSCEAILKGNFPIGHTFITPLSGRFSHPDAEERDSNPPLRESDLPEARIPLSSQPEYVPPSRGYKGRWIPLCQVLLYLLTVAFKHSLLILPEDTTIPVEIEFGSWFDGKTALGHSIIVILIFLVWNGTYTKASRTRWIDVIRFYPLCLSVLPENIVSIEYLARQLREEVRALRPLQWAGRVVIFKFRMLIGDNSVQQKFTGNSVGGDLRCQCCDLDFSSRAVWSWKYMASRFVKTLASNLKRFLAGDAEDVGLPRLCRLLGDSLEDLRKLDLSSPELHFILTFVIGLDPLHNCRGHTPDLIDRLSEWPGWDEGIFVEATSKIVQRRLVSEMNGAKLRLLVAAYEETIMPALHALPTDVVRQVSDLLHNLREVSPFF